MSQSSFSQLEQFIKQTDSPSHYQTLLLLRLFHHIHPRMTQALNHALEAHDLQQHEWMALRLLANAPNQQMLPSQLSVLLDLTRTSLTRLSDDLVSKGLLRRHGNRHDRRQIVLELTEAGLQCVQITTPILMDACKQLLSPFSATERIQFEQLLKRLLAQLEGETDVHSPSVASSNFHRVEDGFLSCQSHTQHIEANSKMELDKWLLKRKTNFG